MKVKVVGNGISWVARPNSSFIVNDEMLVDTPNGSSKFMVEEVDFSKIRYILITHFHSDHFLGLHMVFDLIRVRKIPFKVKVIAPRTCMKKLLGIFALTESKRSKAEICEFFDFYELKAGVCVQVGDYLIKTFKTKHNVKHCMGYVVEDKKGVKVGFTGDTAYCQGLIDLIEESVAVFIDTSSTEVCDRHLSTGEVIALRKKYPNKKFYSVHVNEEVLKNYQNRLDIPEVAETFEIEN